eukprot:SAG11_NODE_15746_length_567_cov_1.420940_1_plen_81_part_01
MQALPALYAPQKQASVDFVGHWGRVTKDWQRMAKLYGDIFEILGPRNASCRGTAKAGRYKGQPCNKGWEAMKKSKGITAAN